MVGKIERFPAQLDRTFLADTERTRHRHVELDQSRSPNCAVPHVPVSTHRGNLEGILIKELYTRSDVRARLAFVERIDIRKNLISGLTGCRCQRAIGAAQDREEVAGLELKDRRDLPVTYNFLKH